MRRRVVVPPAASPMTVDLARSGEATMTEAQLLAIVQERIVAAFRPLKVILFESRGRNEGRPDSDLDLLVVLARMDDKRSAAVSIRRASGPARRQGYLGDDATLVTRNRRHFESIPNLKLEDWRE